MNPNPQAHIVDLRSDTVTRPTEEMLQAMREAPLGDDVLGDDPTVAALEARAAELLGHEAAMFVPSGTMGNQCAIAAHTQPGDVMIVEEEAHVLYYEVGAPAVLNSVLTRTIPSDHGVVAPESIERAIMKASLHTPGTALICLENTHNRAGGTVIPQPLLPEYRRIADTHGLKLHLDGARVFNAAAAQGVEVREITRTFDSVSFCLSKGLGAPVGSVLTGSASLIERARIWRKRLGGGMRQSGLLAACGLVSLRNPLPQLQEDHRRTRLFAQFAQDVPGIRVNLERVESNILMLDLDEDAENLLARLRERDVWALAMGPSRVRFVFHGDIDDEKLARAKIALEESCRSPER